MLGWFSFRLQSPRASAIDAAEGEPGTVAALDAVQAVVLDARPAVDLVARRRLPGQPQRTRSSTCRRRSACVAKSGSRVVVHFVGSPAFMLTHMLATFCRLIW